jgi:hypothetical protein
MEVASDHDTRRSDERFHFTLDARWSEEVKEVKEVEEVKDLEWRNEVGDGCLVG